jgi:hypothetical protein
MLFSRLSWSLKVALGVGLCAVPAWSQPPVAVRVIAPAPWQKLQPPVTQTVNGVTLQITEACWCLREQIEPDYAGQPEGKRRMFAIRYRAQDERGTWRINGLESHSPTGAWINRSGDAGEGDDYVSYWAADEIDPRWSQLRLDINFLDPKAPEDTDRVYETHEFKGVPVPAPDVVAPLDLELQTAHGTRVRLEKIAVLAQPKKADITDLEKGTYFVFHTITPADQPDISARIESGFYPITDEKGNAVLPSASSTYFIDPFFEQVQNGDLVNPPPGYFALNVKNLPSPDVKTLNVKFKTWESSPRWKAEQMKQWGRSFKVQLDLQNIDLPAPKGALHPLSVARGRNVEVALESLNLVEENGAKHWKARFWTRDLKPDARAVERRWAPIGSAFGFPSREDVIEMRDEKGVVLPLQPSGTMFGGNQGLFWHVDNTPLEAGESLFETDLGTLGYPAQPKQLNFQLKLEARREDGTDFAFSDLPIPRPGEVVEVNQAGRDVLNALPAKAALGMTVRKIGFYDAKHPLPGLSERVRAILKHSAGLVVVLDIARSPNSGLFYRGAEAADETGVALISADDSRGGDALDEKDRSGRDSMTYFLLPPTPGATTFSMRIGLGQSAALGFQETVKLPTVPVPTP